MAGYTLRDPSFRGSLFPFTYTRPVAACRTGILTIREKWERHLGEPVQAEDALYLPENLRVPPDFRGGYRAINGALLPDENLLGALSDLKPHERLVHGDTLLAWHLASPNDDDRDSVTIPYAGTPTLVRHPWDFCRLNDQEIRKDFLLITRGRRSASPDELTRLINPSQVFIEPGATVTGAVLNASEGPVYIGKHAVVMEGALIRGPFALGEAATVKMGTRIYGATTLGPGSVAGGEIKNSILFGYANKGHDGYLGDAVIGEWCNLGAGTSCSNLKNNLTPVKIRDEQAGSYREAGLKCGLLMGDYSRTAVNTTFNTGSLVGVSTHVFGAALPPAYLTSFLWAGDQGIGEYRLEKALSDAAAWKALKGHDLTDQDKSILRHVFQQTSSYRKSFLHS